MVNNISGNPSGTNIQINSDNQKTLEYLRSQIDELSNDSLNDLIMKADSFKEKVGNEIDNPRLDDESIGKFIQDKESIVSPVKIKADVFKNQVSRFSENSITTQDNFDFKNNSKSNEPGAKLNINSFNFSVKSGRQNENRAQHETSVTVDNSPAAYVSLQFENATEQIKDLIDGNEQRSAKDKSSSSNAFSEATMLLLTDAVRILEKNQGFTPDKLNKMIDIINKIIVGQGDKLSNAELKQLKEFCEQVVENSEKMGIRKNDFQELSTLLDGVMVAREAVKGKREEFFKQAEITGGKLEALVNIVSDPSLKIDANFVEMLNIVKAKYNSIKKSDDPVAIALYSAYLDKVMQALEDIKSGKQKDPSIFRKIQTEYENFSSNLFKKLGTNQVPVDDLKAYLGEASGPVISMLQMEVNEIKNQRVIDQKPSGTGPLHSVVEGALTIFERRKRFMSYTPDESSKISRVNLNIVRKAFENKEVSSAISEIRSSIADLNIKYKELSAAELNLMKCWDQTVNLISSKEFLESWKKLMDGYDLVEPDFPEMIKLLIDNADRMTDELNLSVSPEAADMIELLKIFRKIIVELDIELRRIHKKEDEQDLIDEKFSKAVRDNKERQKMLDHARQETIENIEKLKDKKVF